MLLKFFHRGTGKGKTPIDYLLKDKDANGLQREPLPEVVKGDPQQVVRLIDSLDFKHKYCSGVISFAPEDSPTPQQQRAVIESFEKTAFAGIDSDCYSCLWIKHTHTTSEGRVELHFVTPRVELETGKSLNIAPPGWANYFRPWRDYWNYSEGWASPDDPRRARTYQPGYEALIDAQNHRLELAGKAKHSREDIRKEITTCLTENIQQQKIKNRKDVIQFLQQSGLEITRQGENYLTVYSDEIGKRVRLKGGIYQEFWPDEKLLSPEEMQPPDRISELIRAREALEELEPRVNKRAEYNQQKYNAGKPQQLTTREYIPLAHFLELQLGNDSVFKWSKELQPKLRKRRYQDSRVENVHKSVKNNQNQSLSDVEKQKIYLDAYIELEQEKERNKQHDLRLLREWYSVAENLGRPQEYLKRIREVATDYKRGVPLSDKAAAARERDLADFQENQKRQSKRSRGRGL